jgi:CheY-like chemotaxis protein
MTLTEATILVVDDEPELLDIFAIWLRRSGCTVFTAINGAEALKILTVQKVDALISDVRMPIMDGMTLVRKLVELGIFIPSIIFISGFGIVDAREMYSLGVESMISKPLNRQQLLDALASSLKDRDQLWIDPPPLKPAQSVATRCESLETALANDTFALGRGGCCFYCERPLSLDQPVQLSIHFIKEDCRLEALGIVRWQNSETKCTGVEFTYLNPVSRPWVLELMQQKETHSFIPRC